MYRANQHNPMLSKHFDLFTLCASETAEAQGWHNLPPADVIENLRALCSHVLDPLVDHFDLPVNVTSGYRHARLNAEIGGLAASQHITGQAADLMVGGLTAGYLARWIAENLEFDELILEKFAPATDNWGWVHVSYSTDKNRRKISTFDGQMYHDGLLDLPVCAPISTDLVRP